MIASNTSIRLSYKVIGSLGSQKDIKSLPFNQGIKALNGLILRNQAAKLTNSTDNPATRKSMYEFVTVLKLP